MATRDLSRQVPARLRGRFVAAYQGQYGFWFEFDGSVRFRDPKGQELGFAYGATVGECKAMMKRNTVMKGAKNNDR